MEEGKEWVSHESFTEKDSVQTQELYDCLDKEFNSFESPV